jgi:hypothetical protein
MTWPQVVIAVWLAVPLVISVRAVAASPSGGGLWRLAVAAAIVAGLVYVLHVGGFW